ncbi:fibronectin type III domain-containing protein [Microbacterium sp. P02]|uniref:fibronectin type III domain-containing protein n=1 Tax=Microbacterium sp. P02 TaxID=3366260 RepID=UPI00366BA9CB
MGKMFFAGALGATGEAVAKMSRLEATGKISRRFAISMIAVIAFASSLIVVPANASIAGYAVAEIGVAAAVAAGADGERTAAAAAASAPWVWQTPTPTNLPRGGIVAQDCAAASTTCVAVDGAGFGTTYDGSTWSSLSKIPGMSSAVAVSCATQLFCVAVGRGGAWSVFNGNSWAQAGVVASKVDFVSVSCATAEFCVGTDAASKASVLKGTSWSIPATVNGGTGVKWVDCVSATFCMVVGAGGKASTFNGTVWAAPKTAAPADLLAVSCVGSSFCAAITIDRVVLYKSGVWQAPIANARGSSALLSIACVTNSNCLISDGAASYYYDDDQTTVWKFNGSDWNTPVGEGGGVFYGPLACASATLCVMQVGPDGRWPLPQGISRYDGTTWTGVVDFPNQRGLDSVSCSSASQCAAVNFSGGAVTYNGSYWAPEVAVFPYNWGASAVSCVSATFCASVGVDKDRGIYWDTPTQMNTFNGGTWGSPVPVGSSWLVTLSCTSTSFCLAVNIYGGVQIYRSGGWAYSSGPSIEALTTTGVSCVSATFCALKSQDKVFTFNGTAWSPTNYTGGVVSAISCATSTYCVAIDSAGASRSWNGTAWSAAASTGLGTEAVAVSCRATTSCVAVGSAAGGNASTFDGSTWTARTGLASAGATFTGVSCGSSTFCMATDSAGYSVSASPTLASAPVSYVLSQTGTGTATMTWQPPAVPAGQTITGYRVSRDGVDSAGQGAYTGTVASTIRSFSMTRLVPGQTYTFAVQAITAAGSGMPTSGRIKIVAPTPVSFALSQTAAGTATMTWQPPAVPAGQTITGYRVSRDGVDAAGQGAYASIIPATARTFSMTRLVLGNSYTLTVRAITSAGAGLAVSGKITLVADPPTSFKVTQTAAATATMTWQPPVVPAGHIITGYRVSRDGVDSTGQGAYSSTVAATVRSFAMTRLVVGKTYTLNVQAITAAGTGSAASGKLTIK